jgi:hypothetical protein
MYLKNARLMKAKRNVPAVAGDYTLGYPVITVESTLFNGDILGIAR